MDEPLQHQLKTAGVIATVTIETADAALPLAQALLEGGVTAIELTLRTEASLPALEKLCAQAPELIVGAGTVLTPDQARRVHAAGAAFGVAPGMNPRVVEAAHAIGLPFAPGICTPSDIEAALESGCRCLKFFPAEPSGGLAFLRAMATPYAHLGVQFIPLGGVSPTNAASYLAEPSVLALGGSWIAPTESIRDADWDGITQRARAARRIVDQVRTAAS